MDAVTVFVRTEGGTILEMDVPAEGTMARDAWQMRFDKGELALIEAAHWVKRGDGSSHLVEGDVAPAKKKRADEDPAVVTD